MERPSEKGRGNREKASKKGKEIRIRRGRGNRKSIGHRKKGHRKPEKRKFNAKGRGNLERALKNGSEPGKGHHKRETKPPKGNIVRKLEKRKGIGK